MEKAKSKYSEHCKIISHLSFLRKGKIFILNYKLHLTFKQPTKCELCRTLGIKIGYLSELQYVLIKEFVLKYLIYIKIL